MRTQSMEGEQSQQKKMSQKVESSRLESSPRVGPGIEVTLLGLQSRIGLGDHTKKRQRGFRLYLRTGCLGSLRTSLGRSEVGKGVGKLAERCDAMA